MPLPPPPARKASRLAPEAYLVKASRKKTVTSSVAEAGLPVAPLELAAAVPDAVPDVALLASAATPAAKKTRARRPATPAVVTTAAPADAAVTAMTEATAAPVTAPPVPAAAVEPAPAVATPAKTVRPTKSPAAKSAAAQGRAASCLFVLDTNVLMHDPMSLFRFEEHDIYLPMIVLEELDGHKKGMTEVARNARQASRMLDQLAAKSGADIAQGLPLDALGNKDATGVLLFQTEPLNVELPALPRGKADNQILGVVQALKHRFPSRSVVLVSKDINMRVKARALGLSAEDYENDKVLADDELLYAGSLALPADFWTRQGKKLESWQQGGQTYYRVNGAVVEQMSINQFVYFEAPGEPALYARVSELRGKSAVLRTLKDYAHQKNAVWGVMSRNREQNFALNLLLDPDIDFVTLAGTAGTGKTLMALAAGLTQVLDERRYTEIIMTRATVSVGEDIGFLPGTEEEKMGPWMGALDDNLEFLAKGEGGNAGEWGRAATNELIRSRIKIKSLNFMRGRTFMNKFVIIDEAQNLTPKQMKTLITRAGPGTKIVCMGNLAQIDTPYLTEGSSGLTYAVDRFKGWPHGGHITLARGERSRLADFASDAL